MTESAWFPRHYEEDGPPFRELKPACVLYEIDFPTTFTVASRYGLCLAHWCDEAGRRQRFVVSPTSDRIIDDLEHGVLSIRDALDQPWLWIVDIDGGWTVTRALRTALAELPPGVVPEPHVMLSPDLDPAFSVKFEGRQLDKRHIPASVILCAVDGAYGALKRMADSVRELVSMGRPDDEIRSIFDLPAQRIVCSSFEISFRHPLVKQSKLPIVPDITDYLQKIGEKLSSALRWSAQESDTENEGEGLPALDLLEAIERLIPPQHGVVERVKVSGSLLHRKEYVLTRHSSRKVRTALVKLRSSNEQPLQAKGRPRELDKDRMTFTLRETADGQDLRCSFSDDLYDDMRDHFHEDARIIVIGKGPNSSR